MSIPPLDFAWDGEAMHPRHPKLADRYFVVGQTYSFVEHHDRSQAAHAHYFAAFKDIWDSLPDEMRNQFPAPDLWRKRLLIQTGFCDTKTVVCSTITEAVRWAAIVAGDWDLIDIRGRVITMWRAWSQSYPAMDKAKFAASSEAVLRAAGDALEAFHTETRSPSTNEAIKSPLGVGADV